jgi:hypothetical protein
MIPAPFANFVAVSTQASAALIGLLFVSVSISPEHIFGPQAPSVRQTVALSAFTALANAFFISFSGLLPPPQLGFFAIALGIVCLSQTLSLVRLWPRWQRERRLVRGLTIFLVSAGIYSYEIVTGVQLVRTPTDTAALTTLMDLLMGTYGLGLVRAWELLGAPSGRGLLSQLVERLGARGRCPGHAG